MSRALRAANHILVDCRCSWCGVRYVATMQSLYCSTSCRCKAWRHRNRRPWTARVLCGGVYCLAYALTHRPRSVVSLAHGHSVVGPHRLGS